MNKHDATIAAETLEALPPALTTAWEGKGGPSLYEALTFIRQQAGAYRAEAGE